MKKAMLKQTGTAALIIGTALVMFLASSCSSPDKTAISLEVPRGYMPVLEVEIEGRVLSFGPFVGYYFRPQAPDDLKRIDFVCFNERSFYTRDLPENALLFEGEALLTPLKDTGFEPEFSQRITPYFFKDVPVRWLRQRPPPQDEFVHFHSLHDALGPVMTGYWIRHVGKAEFTYDMGGRVTPDSVLYHNVTPGPDKGFARIVEFDRGPDPLSVN